MFSLSAVAPVIKQCSPHDDVLEQRKDVVDRAAPYTVKLLVSVHTQQMVRSEYSYLQYNAHCQILFYFQLFNELQYLL